MNLTKLTKILTPVLVAVSMASCSSGPKTLSDQDIVDSVAKIGSLVINASTGSPFSDPTVDQQIKDGEYLYVTKYVNKSYNDAEGAAQVAKVDIVYAMDDASKAKWTYSDRVKDDGGNLLKDKGKYSLAAEYQETFTTTLTATLTYNSASSTVSWKIKFVPINYTPVKLSEFRTSGLSAGGYAETCGYITGGFTTGDIYAGVTVASGEQAIMLYAGNLSELWTSQSLAVGDLIHFKGQYAPYNGLAEVKPTKIEKITTCPAGQEAVTPVVLALTESNYNKTALAGLDGRIATMSNLVYTGHSTSDWGTTGKAWTLYFKVGTVTVDMAVNYHMGSVEQNKFLSAVNSWTANTTTVNFHDGALGWFNNPQLMPFAFANLTVL